jgi:hypothetical protein
VITLWDGTANAPWGRMLFCDESVLPSAESVRPVVVVVTPFQRVRKVRQSFGDRWFTVDEMADATGLAREDASSAIGWGVKIKVIQRERKAPMRGRIVGGEKQRYQFRIGS